MTYLRRIGGYSVIVQKEGSVVWAEDEYGKTIAHGEAGVDDAAVMQAAIDACPHYGVLYVQYAKLTNTVTISKPITITGEKIDVDIAGSNDAILIHQSETYVEQVAIKDLFIRAVNPSFDGWLIRGINARLTTLHNVCLHNPCGSHKCASFEKTTGGIWHIWIDNCKFWEGWLYLGVHDSWITNSTFNGINSPCAIQLDAVSDIKINSCHIIPPLANVGSGGILITGVGDFVMITNTFFDGSYDTYMTAPGLVVQDMYRELLVSNCSFWNHGRQAMVLTDINRSVISNNTFKNNNKEDAGYADILLIGVSVCSNNIFSSNIHLQERTLTNQGYVIECQNAGVNPINNSYRGIKVTGNYLSPKFAVKEYAPIVDSTINGANTTLVGSIAWSGDGSTTSFSATIPAWVESPHRLLVQMVPNSAGARIPFSVSVSGNTVSVTFDTPPPAGTNNVVMTYYAQTRLDPI